MVRSPAECENPGLGGRLCGPGRITSPISHPANMPGMKWRPCHGRKGIVFAHRLLSPGSLSGCFPILRTAEGGDSASFGPSVTWSRADLRVAVGWGGSRVLVDRQHHEWQAGSRQDSQAHLLTG